MPVLVNEKGGDTERDIDADSVEEMEGEAGDANAEPSVSESGGRKIVLGELKGKSGQGGR